MSVQVASQRTCILGTGGNEFGEVTKVHNCNYQLDCHLF